MGGGGVNKVRLPIYQVNWPPVFLMSMFRVNDRDGRSDRSLKANILSSLQAAIAMKASQLPNGRYSICTRSSRCVNRLTMYAHSFLVLFYIFSRFQSMLHLKLVCDGGMSKKT